jgi:hypothetical protein
MVLSFSSLLGSMAHLPDYMSQSFYSDSIDPILPSDSFSFEPSEPTESQTTELTPLPLPLPPSIQRIGDRTKQWALWTEMTKAKFIEWWLTTQYGIKPEAKRIRWDKKGRLSDIWTHFDQIANIHTGKPKIVCKRCDMILEHPVLNGTSGMHRHWKNGQCQRKGKQTDIKHLMQKVVCLLEREK